MLQRAELAAFEDHALAPYAVRSLATRGRLHPEAEHAFRLAFQRDRDRIIHSTAFRRLEYKTQVFVNHEGDYYRTRLTHTMEAAQITRTVARGLRLNTDLGEAVALAHDLGHTPFGHAGERVLNDLMVEHGGFEHNAHSLRLVDQLEERYPHFPGLNLTWEVREGIVKHTPPYDKPLARDFEPGRAPSLEAQLVDYTDEIAYNSHDIDDGLKSGLLTFEQLEEVRLWRDAFRQMRDQYPDVGARIWRYQSLRHIIDLLVTDLVATIEARLNETGIRTAEDVRSYGKPLVGFSPALEAQRRELKDFLMKYLYRHYQVVRMAEKARRVMTELFNAFLAEPQQLPPHVLQRRAPDLSVARVISDYIAGMTDRFVLQEHRRLFDPLEKG